MSETVAPSADSPQPAAPANVRDPSPMMSLVLMVFGASLVVLACWHAGQVLTAPVEPPATLANMAEPMEAEAMRWGRLVLDGLGVLFGSACCIVGALLRWA
ncbi:MAG: hypothetical protein NT069_08025 [Planctomycetota bacterium]|nr:hypothetical protein [Planctomycetota bacterium]